MEWEGGGGRPASRVGRFGPGDTPEQGAEDAPHDVRVGMREHARGFPSVEPYPVAVGALIDLDAVPLPGDQIVAALRALHVVGATLGFGRGLLDGGALLPEQLGVPFGEVFVFVSAGFVGHRPQGVEDDFTVSVSPPGRAGPCGGVANGEDDCPLYPWPGQRSTASTTWPFWRNTTSAVPQVYSQPFG